MVLFGMRDQFTAYRIVSLYQLLHVLSQLAILGASVKLSLVWYN